MAAIEPLRALRFNPAQAPDLTAVTAPPYDVIDAALQAELLAEPHSITHLDFNAGSTDLNDSDNRYRRAATKLGAWRDAGVLQRDSSPALYVYEQAYEWAGEQLSRFGFICRVRLEPFGQQIHPHEQTFSGPKQDRFNLTVETRCNLSQVLGIYPDPDREVTAPLAESRRRRPDMLATGYDGSANRIWIETDPAVIQTVCRAMADRPLYIADGHHRYETALRYKAWLQEMEQLDADHPAHYTTFACVGSGDPGLRVMPTHRVLHGLRGFDVGLLRRQLTATFEWREADVDPHDGAALDAWIAAQPASSLGLLTDTQVALLVPRSPDVLAAALPDASPTLRQLNVSLLHQGVLPTGVEPVFGHAQIQYVHLATEAVEAVAHGAPLAFLLRATPVETVIEVAGRHELMPQKSTYFYPKVLTGLVLYPLRD